MKSSPKIAVHCAYDKMVALDKIKPNPENPNEHPERQIKVLARIIKAQGWRNPITVSNRSGLVVSGHGRLMAAQLLELTHAPVDYQDYESEGQEFQQMLADNRIPELSKLNREKVLDLIETKIRDADLSVDLTGYVDVDLKDLDLGDAAAPPAAPMAKKESKTMISIQVCSDSFLKSIEKILVAEKIHYSISKIQVSELPTAGLKTYLHISQKNVKHNKKTGDRLPVVTARNSRGVTYGHVARIDGPSRLIYRPDDPLACGARVFLETTAPVTVA